MNSQGVKNQIKKLPDAPGVYQFLRGKKILYVGKATSLKDRVRSYFNLDIVNTRSPLISKMLTQFSGIKFVKTDSVLEALILEANIIKKYQPEANIKEKDNRSFNYVIITDEIFPRVLIIRQRELENNFSEKIAYSFGPFPNGSQLKEAMKIIRKMFPYRDRCIPFFPSPEQGEGHAKRGVGCFNRQIGLCLGVCTGEISQKEYAQTIKNIILFFESNKKKLIKNLEKQMQGFAKARQFEKAQKIKKTIFTLNHIQDISLIKDQVSKSNFDTNFRIESYDIAHLSGTNMVGVMTVLENGEVKKSDYRKFSAKGGSAFGGKTVLGNSGVIDDTKALAEILTRRLAHIEWPMADLIVVDGGIAQKNAVEKVLKQNGAQIPVVSVVKDEHHKPKEILGMNNPAFVPSSPKASAGQGKTTAGEGEILLANAEAHRFAISFHRKLRGKFLRD